MSEQGTVRQLVDYTVAELKQQGRYNFSKSLQEKVNELKDVYQELMEKTVEFGRLLNELQSHIDKKADTLGEVKSSEQKSDKNSSQSTKKYLNASQVAEMLNLCKSSNYKMKSSGSIPFYKIGGRFLFKGEEIEEWISNL